MEFEVSDGYVALIDEEDRERVLAHRWRARTSGLHRKSVYAFICEHGGVTFLHHFVLSLGRAARIDHIDGNGLNCQKLNLRHATQAQNIANSRKRRSRTTSRFKGVSWHKAAKKWVAQCHRYSERSYLGLFPTEESAALAYDEAARRSFGEFAALNFPQTGERHALEVVA